MIDLESNAVIAPPEKTFSWGFDLCWPRESPSELPDAFAGLRIGGDEVELTAALLGRHPLDRIRALFNDSGSLHWLHFSAQHRISTRALEELAARWPLYGAAGEWELLEAVRHEDRRDDTRSWQLLSDRAQAALIRLEAAFRIQPEHLPASGLVRRIAEAAPAALARRIGLDAAACPTIPVCLPFLDRRANAARQAEMETMRVEMGADGRLWVLRGNEESALQLNRFNGFAAAAGPWLAGRPHPRPAGFSLTFEDTRVLTPGHVSPEYIDVLDRYGLQLPPLSEPVQATLHLRLPGESVMAWVNLPAEREETYFESFRPVAIAVQRSMRLWLSLSWFWDFEQAQDIHLPQSRLAYCATPPFQARPRESFAYEILDERSRQRALDGAREALPALLVRARQRLLAAGRTARSRHYAPRSLVVILNMLRRQRRSYDACLLADTQTIDQLSFLAAAGRNLRQAALREPARAAHRMVEFMDDFLPTLNRRLRRLVAPGELPLLPSLLILEATHALSPSIPIEATLVLTANGRTEIVRPQ